MEAKSNEELTKELAQLKQDLAVVAKLVVSGEFVEDNPNLSSQIKEIITKYQKDIQHHFRQTYQVQGYFPLYLAPSL